MQLKLGTRGSALALWQARWVQSGLESTVRDLTVEIVEIRTTGDRIVDRPLSQIGGKGLFTRELDQALLDGRIDLAVHSLKDLPFRIPDGIALAAVLERADPRDAFVSDGRPLAAMPPDARIGTSSLRRRAQLLSRFPQLRVVDLRGNVDTRLRKVDEGTFDGIVLATAGLVRLGHADRISESLPIETMLPAVGQGVVAAMCRSDAGATLERLSRLDHRPTRLAVEAERALLEVLEGGCQVPIGGHALVEEGGIRLHGLVASPDGRQLIREEMKGPENDPGALGRRLATRLLEGGARNILEEIARHGN